MLITFGRSASALPNMMSLPLPTQCRATRPLSRPRVGVATRRVDVIESGPINSARTGWSAVKRPSVGAHHQIGYRTDYLLFGGGNVSTCRRPVGELAVLVGGGAHATSPASIQRIDLLRWFTSR